MGGWAALLQCEPQCGKCEGGDEDSITAHTDLWRTVSKLLEKHAEACCSSVVGVLRHAGGISVGSLPTATCYMLRATDHLLPSTPCRSLLTTYRKRNAFIDEESLELVDSEKDSQSSEQQYTISRVEVECLHKRQ